MPLTPDALQRLPVAGGVAGWSCSCVLLLLLHWHLRKVHARRVPWVAPPLGPPSARGEPPPALHPVAAGVLPCATRNSTGVAIMSSATFWTPLHLAFAACWELRRAARSGRLVRRSLWDSFRVLVALAVIVSASKADAPLPRCIWMPAVFPSSLMWHMGGAPIMLRARARSAGSGVATTGRVAEPPISAVLAIFIKVLCGATLPGPPPLACRVRYILLGISWMPCSVLVALRIAARLHARRGGASSCFTSPAWESSQTGVWWRTQDGRRNEKEPMEELHEYVFLPIMLTGMPIVVYILVLRTNGIPVEARVKTYEHGHKMVGVVELSLASGFAPASTVLRSGRNSLGSAVADFLLATGSAPTSFPWLLPRGPLAFESTENGYGKVAGVA